MAVPDGPLSAVDQDPVDDEWERFQANGCPDWWLLAKYVGQAARNIPYQPFRSMSVGGGGSAEGLEHSSRRPMELQQRQQKQHFPLEEQHGPHAASRPAGMSLDSQHTQAAAPEDHGSLCPSSAPDALPTPASRRQGGLTAPPPAAGSATGSATPACGLKGLFGCTGGCAPPCAAAQPADPAT